MTQLKLTNANVAFLPMNIEYSASLKLPTLQRDIHRKAPGFIICGTGPTLLEPKTLKDIRRFSRQGFIVIAVKQAIRLLKEQEIKVHYSFAMDPGAAQLKKTPIDKEVNYIVASSCHPAMFDYLTEAGCKITVVHSACGATKGNMAEMNIYEKYYPDFCHVEDVMSGGYTVVNRAVHAAEYMGARQIIIAGAPFGWREGTEYYAKSITEAASNATGPTLGDNGSVDGKLWFTKADLLPSAVSLAKKAKKNPGKFIFLGDSLAKGLEKKDENFLQQIIKSN